MDAKDPYQTQLIKQAVAGDSSALERLLVEFGCRLTSAIEAKIPVRIHAVIGVDDIIQKTFVKAFQGIQDLQQPTPAVFASWLHTIADRELLNTIKGMDRKKRGGDHHRVVHAPKGDAETDSLAELVNLISDGGASPSANMAMDEAIGALNVGLAALPVDQREAIRLHYLEGRSVEETAATMDRSTGAVRGLIQRGKRRLGDLLERASKWFSTG